MTSRLLVVGHAADRTGPPIYLLDLLRWVRANRPGVDVEVALPAGGALLDELRALAPVTVFEPLPGTMPDDDLERWRRGEIDEAAWWANRRAVAMREMMAPFGDCGVVYVNGAPAVELARALPPGERVMISHVHELEIGLVQRLGPDDRDSFLHGATQVFAVADAVSRHLVEDHAVDAPAIEIHRGMVDVAAIEALVARVPRDVARAERGVEADHHVVGACGTLEYRKGVDLFLRTAWYLRRDHDHPFTFVWVGGDEAGIASARERAEVLGVDDVVRFVGSQPDPATWFGLMDVFLMPSREDPFPLVCLEAVAAGAPIVAFDTGGIPELLVQGCGEVVPYPDVALLAERVRAVLDDPDRRRAMSERGTALVWEQHDVSVVAPQTWAAIERWMDRT